MTLKTTKYIPTDIMKIIRITLNELNKKINRNRNKNTKHKYLFYVLSLVSMTLFYYLPTILNYRSIPYTLPMRKRERESRELFLLNNSQTNR